MGQSTDAILVYGIQVTDGEDGDNLPEWLVTLAGVEPDEDGDIDEWGVTQALEKIGLTIVAHCSCDYPMHILAAHGSETRARRGSPREFDTLPTAEPEWLALFAEHAAGRGDPRWILCSMWC